MKKSIGKLLTNLWSGIESRLRLLCKKPSPMKRLIAILVVGGFLAVANIYLVITSINNIGKQDAKMEYLKLQHIETLQLQKMKENSDSIKNYVLKNYEYEYE